LDALAGILDVFLGESDLTRARLPLEQIMKIRALSQSSAAGAVRFVFALRELVRASLAVEGKVANANAQHFEARVDELALEAFDAYTRCREHLHEVRISELKRNLHVVAARGRSAAPADGDA
jgi:hypothetical protein